MTTEFFKILNEIFELEISSDRLKKRFGQALVIVRNRRRNKLPNTKAHKFQSLSELFSIDQSYNL